jgi:rod shape determining protein RodA
MPEYSRSLTDSHQEFARSKTPLERLHLDLVLLLPVLMIMAMGLFVLFSASDSDWGTVNRQLRNFIIGFGVLLAVAQVRVDTLQRWAPILYLGALLLLLLVPFFWGWGKRCPAMVEFGVYPFSTIGDYEDCYASGGRCLGGARRFAPSAQCHACRYYDHCRPGGYDCFPT